MRPSKPQSKSQQAKLDNSNPHTQKLDKSSRQDELRERIILILGNALYAGKSIEQISKITKKQLAPFEAATDQIVSLLDKAVTEARISEVKKTARELAEPKDKETWKDWSWRALHYLENRLKELKGGDNDSAN